MSRLYVVIDSDAREKPQTARIHYNGHVSVKWGSRYDSKDLFTIWVSWEKGEDAPTVRLQQFDRRTSFEGFEKL